jgi:integrase
LLDKFSAYLKADGATDRYIDQTVSRLKRVFNGCAFKTLADLRSDSAVDSFSDFLNELEDTGKGRTPRPVSQRTRNHYVVVVKTFCNWAIYTRKIADCPLVHVERVKVTKARKRRAATKTEVAAILKAAENGPEVWGLTGKQRAMLYRVALNTGFRVSELASLTPASFHLESSPYVLLEAGSAKNRTEVEQPIPQPLVKPLKAFLKGLPSDEPIWPGNWVHKAARMIRTDLEAAEVKGLDFHCLRTTFISNLARSGVTPAIAQKLARHSDVNLTMAFYTKLRRDELAAALPCI